MNDQLKSLFPENRMDEFLSISREKTVRSSDCFISSYSAMILGKPSYFSIEALEDSQLLEIKWPDFMQLFDNDIYWVKFLLKFVEKGYMMKERREHDLLLLDAETRYKNFLGFALKRINQI